MNFEICFEVGDKIKFEARSVFSCIHNYITEDTLKEKYGLDSYDKCSFDNFTATIKKVVLEKDCFTGKIYTFYLVEHVIGLDTKKLYIISNFRNEMRLVNESNKYNYERWEKI